MKPNPLFKIPPRAVQPLRDRNRDQWWYVVPPRSSFDWRGAEFLSPTSLEFATASIRARRIGAAVALPAGEPLDPTSIVRGLYDVWKTFLDQLEEGNLVVDFDSRVGIAFEEAFATPRHEVRAVVRVKCWPAVEGVTTPRRDDWDTTL